LNRNKRGHDEEIPGKEERRKNLLAVSGNPSARTTRNAFKVQNKSQGFETEKRLHGRICTAFRD